MLNNLELSIFVPISEVHSNNTSIGLHADGFHWVYGDGIIDPKNISDLDYECRPVNGGVFTPPNTNTTIKLGKRQEILDALALYSIQLTGKQVDITINGKLFKTRIGSWSMDARYISLECSSAYLFNDVQLPLSNGNYVYGIAVKEFETIKNKIPIEGYRNTRVADTTYGPTSVVVNTSDNIKRMQSIIYSPISHASGDDNFWTLVTNFPYSFALTQVGRRLYIANNEDRGSVVISTDMIVELGAYAAFNVPPEFGQGLTNYNEFNQPFSDYYNVNSYYVDNQQQVLFPLLQFIGTEAKYSSMKSGTPRKDLLQTASMIYIAEDQSYKEMTQYENGVPTDFDGYHQWYFWGRDNLDNSATHAGFFTGVTTITKNYYDKFNNRYANLYNELVSGNTYNKPVINDLFEEVDGRYRLYDIGVDINSVEVPLKLNNTPSVATSYPVNSSYFGMVAVIDGTATRNVNTTITGTEYINDPGLFIIGGTVPWVLNSDDSYRNTMAGNGSYIYENTDNIFESLTGVFLPRVNMSVTTYGEPTRRYYVYNHKFTLRISVMDNQGLIVKAINSSYVGGALADVKLDASFDSDERPFEILIGNVIYNKLIDGITWEDIKANSLNVSDISAIVVDVALIADIAPMTPPVNLGVPISVRFETRMRNQFNVRDVDGLCVGHGALAISVGTGNAEDPIQPNPNAPILCDNDLANILMNVYSPAELVIKAIYNSDKGYSNSWGVNPYTVTLNELPDYENGINTGVILDSPISQFTLLDNMCAQSMVSAYINENGEFNAKHFIFDKYRNEETTITEDSIVVDSIGYRFGNAPITSYSFTKGDYKVNISNILETSFPEKGDYKPITIGAYQWSTYATYAENLYLGTKTPFLYLIDGDYTPPKEGLVFKATSKFNPSKTIVFKVFAPKLNGPTWEIPIKILSQSGTALNIYEELDPIINVNENPTWQSYVSLPNTDSNYLLALNIWTEAKNASRHTLDNTQLPSKYTKFDNVLRVSDVNNLILWTVQHNSYQKTFVNFSVPMALMDSLGFELMSWVKIDFGIYKNKPQAGWITKISYDLANHQIHCEFMSALSDEDVLVYNENIENWAAEMVLNESTGNIPQILINENMVP